MTKGLLVFIYKSGTISCANGGISDHCDKAILTGPGIPEIHSVSEERPEVRLMPSKHPLGLKAVPATDEVRMQRAMMGGCFIYTSDDRFPGLAPLPLHDRWE